ncbi:MAG: cupin domain-containing protein [Clostridiaceae bacterium]|nr:cupin domain-containing protein [Clostridiaceae bacterium]
MNIFDIPKGYMPQELAETLLENKNVRIERIVSKNHTTDWLEQDEDEWLVLLVGDAEIEFEDITITLKVGDTMFIPKHQKHRVAKTTKCVWLCIFIGE